MRIGRVARASGITPAELRRDNLSVVLIVTGTLLALSLVRWMVTISVPQGLTPDQTARADVLSTAIFAAFLWFAYLPAVAGRSFATRLLVLLALGFADRLFWVWVFGGGVSVPELALNAIVSMLSALCVLAALAFVQNRRSVRQAERAFSAQITRASDALLALQEEESRVRNLVSQGLHGTVQQSILLVEHEVDALAAAALERQDDSVAASLREISSELLRIREIDVRALGQLIRPVGIELGATQAVELMMQRIPASIETVVDISDELRELERLGRASLSLDRRLMIFGIVQEGVSNALKHGHATKLQLTMRLTESPVRVILIDVDDDGLGIPIDAEHSEIRRLESRLAAIGGSIALGSSPVLPGARLSATVPLEGPA